MAKRIEKKVSRTASITCLSRALSYFERNKLYKSNDYIAPKILPFIFNFRFTRFLFKRFMMPKGIYEYLIARTKYIDNVFDNIPENTEQVLILGAGFDSRAIRFKDKLKGKKVFELDSDHTQKAKIDQFKKRNIEFPKNLKFISINFDQESLVEKLEESGFRKDKTCLFILEGLLMYLDENSVKDLLEILNRFAGKNSIIVFDFVYASVIDNKNDRFGEKDIVRAVTLAGEKWAFGIEKDKIEEFVNKYGFELIDKSNSKKLEQKFFRNNKGEVITKLNETHCILTAKKK
jgi:methyltransferase (TIGR00027 family)